MTAYANQNGGYHVKYAGLIVALIVLVALFAIAYVKIKEAGESSTKKKVTLFKPEPLSDKELQFLSTVKRSNEAAKKAEEEDNKVECSFCNTVVEIPDDGKCPNCGGSLTDAIEEAERKRKVIEYEMMQIQAEMAKDRAQTEKIYSRTNAVKGVLAAAISPAAGAAMLKKYRKKR